MSDTFINPGAAAILTLMIEAEERLPSEWETNEMWLSGAQWLAQFIADQKGKVPTESLGLLLSIGGQMIAMARRERDAASATASFFGRRSDGLA